MIRSGVIPPEMALKANCSVEAVRSGVRSATLLDGERPPRHPVGAAVRRGHRHHADPLRGIEKKVISDEKDLLKLLDLSKEDILKILNTADQLKFPARSTVLPMISWKGKTLAMIFEKNSTRTRVSFETGMYQLGGYAPVLSSKESQIGRGEPVEDTARVLLRYCDGIMIRTFAQEEVETLAAHANIPVINGLTDFCHPCQVLADLMTVREHKAVLEGLKMCYIGDGNNMANSSSWAA